MKWIFLALCTVFLGMQYEIWLAPHSGIFALNKMEQARQQQYAVNQNQQQKNQTLVKSIQNLKHGNTALEEHARYDLGMIKQGEVFYQVVSG